MSPDGTIVSTKWGRRRVLHDGVEGNQKALVRIQRDDGNRVMVGVLAENGDTPLPVKTV